MNAQSTKTGGPKDPNEERRKSVRKMGLALTLPFTMLAGPLVGFGLGYLLDRQLGTYPWLLLFVGLAGVVGSFVRVFQTLRDLK
jgi:ATP synthase protein I